MFEAHKTGTIITRLVKLAFCFFYFSNAGLTAQFILGVVMFFAETTKDLHITGYREEFIDDQPSGSVLL